MQVASWAKQRRYRYLRHESQAQFAYVAQKVLSERRPYIQLLNISGPVRRYRRDKVSGRHSEGVTPVPIPNTAVKPFSADGTVSDGVMGE